MAEIRALERSDLPAVTKLLRANLPAWRDEEQITESLQASFIDYPWADPELPSLVSVEDGELIGFIGCQVRRFRFGDRTLRGACSSHLAVDPGRRRGAAGALLLRRFLTAGQDFTFSDTANEEVARLLQAFGGELDPARACDWMIVLRPLRWLRSLGTGALLRRLREEQVPVGALPFRALRGAGRAVPQPGPDVTGEDVDAATIVEHLPEMTHGLRLWVDYDVRQLDHLFGEITAQFGGLTRRLVRRAGRAVGWYAYIPRSGGVGRVLHVLATDREGDAVLEDLIAHARAQGSTLVSGRLEPHLTRTLERRLPVLGFARRPWIHCHDPEIRAALSSPGSLLTQLEGEWFLA
jgi:hypothetical protein